MAKKDRTGERKTREECLKKRIPELGYYLVVTDAKGTEPCYFNGLRKALPVDVQDKLVIKVVETKTQNIINKCEELVAYNPQYRIPWIVFDRDKVENFNQIIDEAHKANINVGWSNPCFETWMFGYFGKIPNIQDSKMCCSKFSDIYQKNTGQQYEKNDRDLYEKLTKFGDEEQALKRAKLLHREKEKDFRTPSEMIPCTTVYELIDEIRGKINKDSIKKSEKG